MSQKKRSLVWILVIVLAACTVIGGSLAYFWDQEKVTNKFTMAGGPGSDPDTGIDITVTEPNWDPESGKNVLPGDALQKDPTITNIKGESYARLIVTLKDGTTGAVITDVARANKILSTIYYSKTLDTNKSYSSADLAAIPHFNADFVLDTTRGGTGVYYYNLNRILTKTGQTGSSATLFTHVIAPTDWDQTDAKILGAYDIEIAGQIIQAKHLTLTTAWAALDGEMQP